MAILRKRNQETSQDARKAQVIMPKSVTLSTKVLKIDNRYTQTSKENMIGSPSKMLKLYRANGGDLLDRTLNVCRKAWYGSKDSILTTMLTGLHTFLAENTDIDDKILIKALSKVEPKLIKGQAAFYITADTITGLSDGSCRYAHIANVIKDHYNKQEPKNLQIA